jgi:hypothetical protein
VHLHILQPDRPLLTPSHLRHPHFCLACRWLEEAAAEGGEGHVVEAGLRLLRLLPLEPPTLEQSGGWRAGHRVLLCVLGGASPVRGCPSPAAACEQLCPPEVVGWYSGSPLAAPHPPPPSL